MSEVASAATYDTHTPCSCWHTVSRLLSSSTSVPPGHPYDFTEAGVAYLQVEEAARRTYIIREPLALELAGFLGRKLDERPLAIRGWELLLRLQLQGTGATVSKDCAALVARVVCVQDLSDCR